MEDGFRCIAAILNIKKTLRITLAGTATGKIVGAVESIDLEHWVKQLTLPVLFEKALLVTMDSQGMIENDDVDVVMDKCQTPFFLTWPWHGGNRRRELMEQCLCERLVLVVMVHQNSRKPSMK